MSRIAIVTDGWLMKSSFAAAVTLQPLLHTARNIFICLNVMVLSFRQMLRILLDRLCKIYIHISMDSIFIFNFTYLIGSVTLFLIRHT